MRHITYWLVGLLVLAGLANCSGPAVSTNLVLANSLPHLVDPETLLQQPASSVVVLNKAPTGRYTVLEVWDSFYEFPANYLTYQKIERKKHLRKLCRLAGTYGANAIVVMYSDCRQLTGNAVLRDTEGQITELVHTDEMEREFVRTFAIYRQ